MQRFKSKERYRVFEQKNVFKIYKFQIEIRQICASSSLHPRYFWGFLLRLLPKI